jgi:hypothetical protein
LRIHAQWATDAGVWAGMAPTGKTFGRKLYRYFLDAGIPAPEVALVQPLRTRAEEEETLP